jgi:methylated-DNA-[protein]-cysteine S-methyltransferase
MVTTFQKRVLALTSRVPKGKITTYKLIACILKSSPRAVGQALRQNPWPVKIPCHRVVKSSGELGGYSGGKRKKKLLLQKEGVSIQKNKIIDFEKFLYKF